MTKWEKAIQVQIINNIIFTSYHNKTLFGVSLLFHIMWTIFLKMTESELSVLMYRF